MDAGDCTIEDDFQELRDKWVAADAVIYSVPVYHMGIPGQLKCFIDRLGNSLLSFYGGVLSRNLKTVGVVVQGSHIFAGQEQVMTALLNHAVLMSCVPVAGDLWQSYLGAAGWTRDQSHKDSLRRLYDEGEADAEIAVIAADGLGKRVVQMALVIKSGGLIHREMLEEDGSYTVFLSRLASGE
jgi:multimeric flavodoxin WrbA